MIEGIDALVDWMRIHGQPYWKIFHGTKGSQFLVQNEKTNDIEQSIQLLQRAFNSFSEGRYTIVCREELDTNKQKGLIETMYTHTKQPASVNGVQSLQPVTPSFSEDQIEKRINDALDKYKTQQKIEALEKENSELKKEIKEIQPTLLQNRIATILPQIQPYIGGILEKIGIAKNPTTLAVSGINPSVEAENFTPSEVVNDAQTRLENALKLWSEADPEGFINLIEKLAHFAYEKPEQYHQYLPMIDNFLR